MKDSTITTIDTSNLDYSIANEEMEDMSTTVIESIVKQLKSGNEAIAIDMIMDNIEHIDTFSNRSGETLLHEVAKYGSIEVMDLLLTNNPELLYVPTVTRTYPIHYAVANDNVDIVEHMMRINPLILTLEDDIESNPLHIAASFKNINLIPLLLNTDESEQDQIISADGNTYYDDNVMLSIHVAELQNEFGERYDDYLDNVEEMNLVSFFSI